MNQQRMTLAYLSLGSNQQAESNLRSALTALRVRFGEIIVSPTYCTAAEGFDGPDFLNSAAIIDSDLELAALDAWLHALEDTHGRRRDVPRFSSRTLDIDIVFYGALVFEGEGHLQVPRPELRHAFVLKPLADIAPDFRNPVTGITLAETWAAHPQFACPPSTHVAGQGD